MGFYKKKLFIYKSVAIYLMFVNSCIYFRFNNCCQAFTNCFQAYTQDEYHMNISGQTQKMEKIMNRKIITLSLVAGLSLFSLVGCGSSSDSTNTTDSESSSGIVVTGQSLSYDSDGEAITPIEGEDFYGQDAVYASNSFSLRDNGDGTTSDLNTKLMWQQEPTTETFMWAEATEYCEALSLAGYSDWRTPSLYELISIEDFSDGWPYLDTDYFSLGDMAISKDLQFWSSNYYLANDIGKAFGLNYGTGHIKAYSAEATGAGDMPVDGSPQETDTDTDMTPPPPMESGTEMPMGNVAQKLVRCVRGDAYGVSQFVDNGDGTISDLSSGLMWMQNDAGEGLDWEGALAYAENLEYAGYSDWKLPNVKELQSIVDYTGVYPAISPSFFSVTDDDAYYWTSTSAYFSKASEEQQKYYWAWYVAFGYAVDGSGEDSHGAGAVRYDTKVEGGPQGEDAERVYNHVRAVRLIK